MTILKSVSVSMKLARLLAATSMFFLFGSSTCSSEEPLLHCYDAIKPASGFMGSELNWTSKQFFAGSKQFLLLHRPGARETFRRKFTEFNIISQGKVVRVVEAKIDYFGGAGTLLGFTRANRRHTGYSLDFMFIGDRLVQMGTTEQNCWVTTFGRHRVLMSEAISHTPTIVESSYDQFNNGPGGVFGRYYYDDIKGGIAYAIDGHAFDFFNIPSTFDDDSRLNPDWIIVHRPMQAVIAIHDTDNSVKK